MSRFGATALRLCIVVCGVGSALFLLLHNDPATRACAPLTGSSLPKVQTLASIDPSLQHAVSTVLNDDMRANKSQKGLIAVQEISTGQIKAIASQSAKGSQECFDGWAEAFKAWEPGSVMKPLTVAVALNEHKLVLSDQFYNPGKLKFGDVTLLNALNIPAQNYTFQDMVSKSINIGAVEALKRLGDGKAIDQKARDTWHNYLTTKYMFGQPTGAFDHEQSGYVPSRHDPYSTQARYAFSSFGIGITVTPVQLMTAYSALLRDGLYQPPSLQAQGSQQTGERIVSSATSSTVHKMLELAAKTSNQKALREGYDIGGKSGTGPSADITGTYQYQKSNGVYVGFIGKNQPKYVMLVKLEEPDLGDLLAGAVAAELWAKAAGNLIESDFIQ